MMKQLFLTALMAICLAVPASAQKVDADKKSMTSPDMYIADLHGPVHYAVTYSYYAKSEDYLEIDQNQGQEILSKYTFNEDGTFDESSDYNFMDFGSYKLTRNNKGQLTQAKAFVAEFGRYVTDSFKYDAKGRLKEYENRLIEGRSISKYQYLDDGTMCGMEYYEYGEGSKTNISYSYTVQESDKYGNWTRRTVTKGYQYGKDDGTENYNETGDSEFLIETRTITYY